MKCCTVIPVYRELTHDEILIIDNNIEKLVDESDIVFVGPESLDMEKIGLKDTRIFDFPYFSLEDKWFESTLTYNLLCVNPMFYRTFEDYEYILICQPDAYIFKKNSLNEWLEKGYDYIGAPWFTSENDFFYRHVGNGGLSLRKVKTYIEVLDRHHNQLMEIFQKQGVRNEDGVLTTLMNVWFGEELNIPSFEESVFFSWETDLNECKKLTNGKLPFGIHSVF